MRLQLTQGVPDLQLLFGGLLIFYGRRAVRPIHLDSAMWFCGALRPSEALSGLRYAKNPVPCGQGRFGGAVHTGVEHFSGILEAMH